MPRRSRAIGFARILHALTLGLALAAPAVAWGAVQVALAPALQSVAPGAEFDVRIELPTAGTAFNAFDVVVQYDPAVLTFLPASPLTLQQGCLVTGGCSSACGTTFHVFSAAGDSLAVSQALLCNGVTLTGPGNLYTLRFRASNTPQVTALSVRRKEFFDAGLLVTPASATGCQVGIGIPLGVPGRDAVALRVQADPNPAVGRVRLSIAGGPPGDREVDIVDVSGRLVHRLARGPAAATASLVWDGTTDGDSRARAGLYFARVRAGTQLRLARIAWLP